MTLAIAGGAPVRTKPFQTLPLIGEEERLNIQTVLNEGMLSGFVAAPNETFLGGKWVRQLESQFSKYLNLPYAVAMNSATSGLHAALAAVGVKGGDEVICPPYTMSATAAAVLMQNAIPVFSDIDAENFCIHPAEIEKKITSRTKAIIVVHLFGRPAPMDKIMPIAQKHNLSVIEDCAQAPGASLNGKKVGTFGAIGVFSLNQHKIITTGEGGVCVCSNEKLAYRMQLVRNHGEVVLAETKGVDTKEHSDIIGWNYRMPELEAAVGVAQFKRLEQLTEQRINLASILAKGLSGIAGLHMPALSQNIRNVYFVFPILFDASVWGVSRSVFLDALKAEGIPGGGGYVRPIYQQPIYQHKRIDAFNFFGGKLPLYAQGSCPVTERLYERELILLPVCRAPHTESDIQDVVNAFRKIADHRDELKKLSALQMSGK